MRLIVGDSAVLDQPDEAAVRAAFRRLFDHEENDLFIILVDGPDPERSEHFMQAAGSGTDGFVLEYREDSWDRHYQCDTVSQGISGLNELESAFIDYLHGRNTWKACFKWQPLSDPIPRMTEPGQAAAAEEPVDTRFTVLEEDLAELKEGMAELDRKLTTLIAALDMATRPPPN